MTLINQHLPRSARTLAALSAAAVLACAGFLSLGIWQVKRLAWKEDLIARVEQHVHAQPEAAPAPAAWAALKRENDEYRRINISGRFAHQHETLVHASTALGSGYWVITPLRSTQGFWVLVNRGFVSAEWRERTTRLATETSGEQEVIGLLRLSEPGGRFMQANDGPHGRWYSRDVQAMAQAAGLKDAPVAPYFIDITAPEQGPNTAWPRPGLTVLQFTNNHLVYAFTWFALAAMTAGALGYLVIDERRLRRLTQERHSHAHAHR